MTRYAIRNKFTVQEGVPAFKRYGKNLTLVNRHFQGEQGLSMIVHQKSRLLEIFQRNNRNMKLNIRAEGLFNRPETDEDEEEPEEREVLYKLPSTRFNVHNEDGLKQAIEDSLKQILLQIENLEATSSNLQFKKITSITIHDDKYDPTRAGRYIDLPRFIKLKKACINIKNEDNKCFKNCVQSVLKKSIMKRIETTMY